MATVATVDAIESRSFPDGLTHEAWALFRQFRETREADEVWDPIEKTICAGGDIDPWHPGIFPNIFKRLSFLYLYPLLVG